MAVTCDRVEGALMELDGAWKELTELWTELWKQRAREKKNRKRRHPDHTSTLSLGVSDGRAGKTPDAKTSCWPRSGPR
jgi:hypothetical protein